MKRLNTNKFRKTINDYLIPTFQEFVGIIILTNFFLFLSFIGHMRVEPNHAMGPGFVNVFYGFPMEWFEISANEGSWYSTLTKTYILWIGLAINLLLFALLSFVIVRAVDKISDRVHLKH